MTVIEELRARRDLLAQPGVWVNHFPRSGEACLVYNGSQFGLSDESSVAIWDTLAEQGVHPVSLSIWNDNRRRTLPEVLDLLDRTIVRLEATA